MLEPYCRTGNSRVWICWRHLLAAMSISARPSAIVRISAHSWPVGALPATESFPARLGQLNDQSFQPAHGVSSSAVVFRRFRSGLRVEEVSQLSHVPRGQSGMPQVNGDFLITRNAGHVRDVHDAGSALPADGTAIRSTWQRKPGTRTAERAGSCWKRSRTPNRNDAQILTRLDRGRVLVLSGLCTGWITRSAWDALKWRSF